MSLVGLWSSAASAASVLTNVTVTHATLLSQYYTQQYSQALNPDNILDKVKESPTWKWVNSVIPAPANEFSNAFCSSFIRAPSKEPVTPTRTFDNYDLDDTYTTSYTTSYSVTTHLSLWFAHAPSPAKTTVHRGDAPVTQAPLITSTAPPVAYATVDAPAATAVTQPGAASRRAAPLAFKCSLGADGLGVDEQEPDRPERKPPTPWGARVYLGIAAVCIIVLSVSVGAHKIFKTEPYVGCPTQEPVLVITTPNGQYRVMLDESGDYSVVATAREDVTEHGTMNYGPDNSCFFRTADGIPQRVLFRESSVELPPSFMVSPDISLAHETMWESTPVKKSAQMLLPRTPTRTRTSIAHKHLLVDESPITSKPTQHPDSLDLVSVAHVQDVVNPGILPVDLTDPFSSTSSPKRRRLNTERGSQDRSSATRYSSANNGAIRTDVERIPESPTVPRTIVVPATPSNERISTGVQEHPVRASTNSSNHSIASSNLSVCTLPIPAFPSDQMLNRIELPSMASLSPSPVRPQRRATLTVPTSINSSVSGSFVVPNTSTSFISQWPLPPVIVALSPSPTRQTQPTRQTKNMHAVVNSPMPTFVSDISSLLRDELPSITWSLSPSPVRPTRRHKRVRIDNSEIDTPKAPADREDVFCVGLQIQPMHDTPSAADQHYVNIRAVISESPVKSIKRKRPDHALPRIGFPLDVSIVVDRSFVVPTCPSSELIARLELPSFASSGADFGSLIIGCDERFLAVPNAPRRSSVNASIQSLVIPSCPSADMLTRVELPSFVSSQSPSYPELVRRASVRHARQSSSGSRFNPIPSTPPALRRILAATRPSDQSQSQSLIVPTCRSSEMLTRIELPSMTSTSSEASAVLFARNHSPALVAAYKLRELFARSPSASRSGTPRPRVKPNPEIRALGPRDTNRLHFRFAETNTQLESLMTESSLKIPTCLSSDMLTRVSLPDSSSLSSSLHSRDWSVQSTSLLVDQNAPWTKESEKKEVSWASNV